MQGSVLALMTTGAVLAGTAASASAAGPPVPTQVCNGTVSNLTVDGNVWVPAGAACKLQNVRVNGSVWVEEYASLLLGASTVGAVGVKGGGYLNAWDSTAGTVRLNGAWGAYLARVHVTSDLNMNGPVLEGQGIKNPPSTVRPKVYVENSEVGRSVAVENADLTLVGSRITRLGRYQGILDSRNSGPQRSSLVLRNDVMDSLYAQKSDTTVTGSTIGTVSVTSADATTMIPAQFGSADGKALGNRFGSLGVYGTLRLGMWDTTVTGAAEGQLTAPSLLSGARNRFLGPVTGDLVRLKSGTAAVRAASSPRTTDAIAAGTTGMRLTEVNRAKTADAQARKHGSAHLTGHAR